MTTLAVEHPSPPTTTGSILLVEDDDAHAYLIQSLLKKHAIASRVDRVPDGAEALAYLFRRGAYANASTSPRPALVLLDLHLPRVNGLEVLRQMKTDSVLRHIPVVVLTTSTDMRDVKAAHALYANSYLVKPLDASAFADMLKATGLYWLKWNHFRPYSTN